jgi:hypothetical protein
MVEKLVMSGILWCGTWAVIWGAFACAADCSPNVKKAKEAYNTCAPFVIQMLCFGLVFLVIMGFVTIWS